MKYLRVLAMVLSVVVLISFGFPTTALSFQEDKFTLKVGYFPDYGISSDRNGNFYGYIYDYFREIAKINDWGLKFIDCEWPEGLKKLENGEIDVFGGMQKTVKREDKFDFPNYSMGSEYGSIYVKKNNNSIFYRDLKSINGKTVGISEDTYYNSKFIDYCTKNGIMVKTKIINSEIELNSALQSGDVDMIATGSMFVPENSKMVLQFSCEDFYFPTTKGNTYVLNGLDSAIDKIKQKNIYFEANLYDKHYTKTALISKAFTEEEYKFIQNATVLKVAYETMGEPIEYYDKKTNTVKGITIDILNNISEYSGLKFEYIKTDNLKDSFNKIDNKKIDLALGVVKNDEFPTIHNLALTNPIMQVKLAFIIKNGTDFTTENKSMALPTAWDGIGYQMKQDYPNIDIKYYKTVEECLDTVSKGKAYMTVLNTFGAERALKSYAYRELSINTMGGSNLDVCLGTSSDTPKELVSIINKSISTISQDTLNQIVYKYTIGIPYEPSLYEKIRYNSPIYVIIAFLFIIIMYLSSIHTRKKLNKIAFYDSLTGEMNLNKFKIEAQKIINHSKGTYAVIVIDINKFKSVNDLYGYDFGDKMLKFVAKNLRNVVKDDILICRGTADKFNILSKYTNNEDIENWFYKLAKAVEGLRYNDSVTCKIILSGGLCVIEPKDNNIISIIDRANIASKSVKNSHISTIVFYNQSMYDKINHEKEIENNMSAALANNEFIIYLQPKTELATRKMVGAEALVRWLHPVEGLIQPGNFIPLFEENGFIMDLDFYVFEQVCKMLERWKHEYRQLFTISVNLSRRHLEFENTVKLLCDIASKYDVETSLIEIELTESAFVDCDVQIILRLLDSLHYNGFTVSVDDFGSGYSSLSLLKDLPIDVLKIDKSFFGTEQSTKVELLLESVISLSRKMNIKTVSEGVETEQQVNLLMQLGCDLVQGFYFAKPMPIKQLEEKIKLQCEGGNL